MTNKKTYLPAEWEPVGHVLMAWPHKDTDWVYMLGEVRHCFLEIVKAISASAKVIVVTPDCDEFRAAMRAEGIDPESVISVECRTNDTWARDFGFITTCDNDGFIINDFKFNGWGLKFAACHDNLVNSNILPGLALAPGTRYANRLDFVLEGGSIESDGNGTLLTTSNCLLSVNRNAITDKSIIEHRLQLYLGAEHVLWVDYGDLEGDDTDSHIDTLARMLPGNIIACTTCDRPDDAHYACLGKMRQQIASMTDPDGRPYKIIDLPIPHPIYDEDGYRLPATYANFLIVNNAVLLPIYADETYDTIAIEAMRKAMPQHIITPIDCRPLIRQHGSLHCMTMQVPDGVIN